jgi:ferredoxin
MNVFFWAIFLSSIVFFFLAAITSFFEKEVRAGIIFIFLELALGLVGLFLFKHIPVNDSLLIICFSAVVILLILFFFPTRYFSKAPNKNIYGDRIHEADAVLSRRRLKPGTENYTKYYAEHPEYKEADDKARENPGLLSENAKYYDPLTFTASAANFILTDHLHSLDEHESSENKMEIDPGHMTHFIQKWLKKGGAHSVGFTSLEDHHLYSHKGRGKRNGEPILKDLPHAIAISVEMSHDFMKSAPAGPAVMESSEQYLHSGILASQLSLFIKNLGYKAKAHIDGNYEVICPLVASDAGLGIVGRMGLLMTPKLGPRVRIAVVTTDLPLEYKIKKASASTIDFCERCKKCALVCPARAIPEGPRTISNGSLRWKINSESCYNYWTISGTDCGKCMIACPYAHPDNYLHKFFRWGIKNNLLFRILAVKLDDIFYGRRPGLKKIPDWLSMKKQK